MPTLKLINERTSRVVAHTVAIASTRRARRRGLLGRDRMDTGSALMLTPCAAIHTAFMRFPIDVVFLDRHGCAVRVVRRLRPWRIAVAGRARAAIELEAGGLGDDAVVVGDRLYLTPLDAS